MPVVKPEIAHIVKTLQHAALVLLYSLYGLYAAIICAACLLVGGTIALLMPTLGLRRVVARWTLRILFFLAAMPYRFEGLEHLPDGPCVVIANHRSYLDGLVLIAALPPHFSAVIKHEMAEVPVIGWFLGRIGCRFVERTPAESAGRDTRDLLEALEAGESLAIFPEGTFSTDVGLLPFRDGAFFLAAKADVPVVPSVIDGSRKVLPEGRFLPWPGMLRVRVFTAERAEGQDRESIDHLRDRLESTLSHRLKSEAPQPRENHPGYAYYCDTFEGRALPLSYVDLGLLERNIRSVLKRTGSKKLRVDARMLQCPAVIERVMRSSTRFHGVKCSTVAEALRLMEMSGLQDLLVAYPTAQHDVLDRVCEAIADGHGLTLTVDAPAHLHYLSEAARRAEISVPLCVEIDMSMAPPELKGPSRRSAIRSIDALLQMVKVIDDTPGVHFRGVLTYDTQRNHFTEWVKSNGSGTDTSLSSRNARRLREHRQAMVDALRERGHEELLINCGGAGTMAFNAGHAVVTEITVGAELLGLDPEDKADIPAAGYAVEIMRQPGEDLYACLVGGHTASSVADPQILPHPYLPRGARLDELHGAGEAQLPIRYSGVLDIGDMVFLHPANTDELCERFSHLLLVQDGAIIDEVETYRV